MAITCEMGLYYSFKLFLIFFLNLLLFFKFHSAFSPPELTIRVSTNTQPFLFFPTLCNFVCHFHVSLYQPPNISCQYLLTSLKMSKRAALTDNEEEEDDYRQLLTRQKKQKTSRVLFRSRTATPESANLTSPVNDNKDSISSNSNDSNKIQSNT